MGTMANKRKKKNKGGHDAKNRPLNSREERMLRRMQARKQRRNINIFVLVLMFAGLAAYFFWPRVEAPAISSERLNQQPSRGSSEAQVVLTEFGDFGCEACRAWHEAGILDQILQTYDGRLRLEWVDLPIITRQSPKAAEAGQCALDQGLFWEYQDNVYNQPDASVNLGETALKRYAQEIGLDEQAFALCLDSGQHAETVDADLRFARQLGLRSTPSFSVNGQLVIGNPDLLVQAIEQALANQ
jgi:protein-disulfide isomerase